MAFWQWLFDLTNVNSHNQRITDKLRLVGDEEITWRLKAVPTVLIFIAQAEQAVAHRATYVTVLLGNNDVLQRWGNPLIRKDFEVNIEAGLTVFGKKVYPLGQPFTWWAFRTFSQLWNAIETKEALGIVNCRVLWALKSLGPVPE